MRSIGEKKKDSIENEEVFKEESVTEEEIFKEESVIEEHEQAYKESSNLD